MSGDNELGPVTAGNERAVLPEQIVCDLQRVGLLNRAENGGESGLRMVEADLSLFLPLFHSFDIRLVPMTRDACPLYFCTGILTFETSLVRHEKGEQASVPGGGQATTAARAALGCLGELAERISLWTLAEQDTRVFLKQDILPEVELGRVLGLSSTQELSVAKRLDLTPEPSMEDRPNWNVVTNRRLKVRSLTDDKFFQLPSIGVLFHELEREAGYSLSFASSTGCAVWKELAGARERALQELAERDAVAQCWYNRLGITEVEKGFVREILPENLMRFLDDRKRRWGIYSVDTDLDVHVVMAVSFEDGGRRAAFGSSAGWNIVSACDSALQELLQAENSLELMERAHPTDKSGNPVAGMEPRQLAYSRHRSILEDLPLQSAPLVNEAELKKEFDFTGLLTSCIDRQIEILEFNATRPDLGIPCIKLLSPDLCSWEPRFGKKRLYQGVVERGLRDRPATEAEFKARPFPF
ncbi:YcaO-like family protein [Roseibium sp. SCP14]|uniref:YcaO-like family protein n=1 Tax=Roseibium sp. SCP14 TaxID=3141375 RepID=UPI0033364795